MIVGGGLEVDRAVSRARRAFSYPGAYFMPKSVSAVTLRIYPEDLPQILQVLGAEKDTTTADLMEVLA